MNLSKGYLLSLVAVFAVLSVLLVLPFLQYVLAAILVGYLLYPLQRRLEARIGPRLAALSLVALALAGIFVPVLAVVVAISGDAASLLTDLDARAAQLTALEAWIEDATGLDVTLAEVINDAGRDVGVALLQRTTSLLTSLAHVVLGVGMALFLLYYLLKDGDDLVAWLRATAPLPEAVQDRLYAEVDAVMWAVLFGHVLVAVVQGVVAGLGLYAAGIPNAAFWTFVMVILAILPLIGAFLVWGPAAAYLVAAGEALPGAVLFFYGATVVTITDDYLRPIAVDRHANLNPGVIILGVLGGVYAFGVMGLFFGPVVLGGLKTTLAVVTEHYDDLEPGSRDRDRDRDPVQSRPQDRPRAGASVTVGSRSIDGGPDREADDPDG